MSPDTERIFYFKFVHKEEPEPDLYEISSPSYVEYFQTSVRMKYRREIPIGCQLNVYTSEFNLCGKMDFLSHTDGTKDNPLIVVIVREFEIKIKYENQETIVNCSSKNYTTVGDLLKTYPFNEFDIPQGPRELYSPQNELLDRSHLLSNLQSKIKYTLIGIG